MKILTCVALVVLFTLPLNAQRPRIKFGDVSVKDFSNKSYSIDPDAHAVVLFDVGSANYSTNNTGSFSIEYEKHIRIHLLDRNSFDLATQYIPLRVTGSLEDELDKIEASTYNLENGSVQVTKLDKNSVFKDKFSKGLMLKKFTMPSIKEGSIIEIKYKVISPYFFFLRPWQFQENYPKLWCEYSTRVPSYFQFAAIRQGEIPYTLNTSKTTSENWYISNRGYGGNLAGEAIEQTMAIENVPAIKSEKFISTLSNYSTKVEFHLAKLRFPNSTTKDIIGDWHEMAKDLMKNEDFGKEIKDVPSWVTTEASKVAGQDTGIGAAIKIYEYIRDNMNCIDHDSRYLSDPLKKIYTAKKGNVADINLLLTAFLHGKGFMADPVLLSTRDNGRVHPIYPMIDKYNYVICQLRYGDHSYLLDASHNKLGFGSLEADCYNGYARVINEEEPFVVDLSPDSLHEEKVTTVFIINSEKSKLDGSFTCTMGREESIEMRETIAQSTREDYFKEIKKKIPAELDIDPPVLDSFSKLSEPIALKYDFKVDLNSDILYFNPILGQAYNENPFPALERHLPVEMPYAKNESYIFRMDIPKGYAVEELPKSERIKLNGDEGMFEYLISKDEVSVQLRSTLQLNKATFPAEDYEVLREFFGHVVKKQSEQIVLKKIKS